MSEQDPQQQIAAMNQGLSQMHNSLAGMVNKFRQQSIQQRRAMKEQIRQNRIAAVKAKRAAKKFVFEPLQIDPAKCAATKQRLIRNYYGIKQ